MADEKKNIDPFDVDALEKSLNDSATRVSTIWVSFLIFSLYLLTAVTTVTHRQLFLAEPVKLPVLNIDLPLWGFFFLAPILFVILHAYVLIQVLLLARTAAAYNEIVDESIADADDNARIRQRLANTLFAQIFAGSPRERRGWLGWLLRSMAWITLAIAPILILFTFEFMFLPYHSHLVTWTHRALILGELVVVFWLWPLVLDATREFQWRKIRHQLLRVFGFFVWLMSPWDARQLQWRRIKRNIVPLLSCSSTALVSLSIATFPGEPHINVMTGYPWSSVRCERWFAQSFDRLYLPRIDVVDDDKLAKIEIATTAKEVFAFQGERTQTFRERDLRCGVFSEADFRRVDFANARMFGVDIVLAELQGTVLDSAELQGAQLVSAKLQGAALRNAKLQNSNLLAASLQGALLMRAELQGTDLSSAVLIGADLSSAKLHSAKFSSADLRLANLIDARLYGADFSGADLRGAELGRARMQAAVLSGAKLQGAHLYQTSLQGVELSTAELTLANFSGAYLWRSTVKDCETSLVASPIFDPIIDVTGGEGELAIDVGASSTSVGELIEEIMAYRSNGQKKELMETLRVRFDPETAQSDPKSLEVWRACAKKPMSIVKYEEGLGRYLGSLICSSESEQKYMMDILMFNMMSRSMDLGLPPPQTLIRALADSVLATEPKSCPSIAHASDVTKKWLGRNATKPAVGQNLVP